MSKMILHKPIEIDGKEVKEVEYDLEAVTGTDIEKICKSLTAIGYVILAQETDPMLHAHVFAVAAGIDYTDVKRFGLKDFAKATSAVRDFFCVE